MRVSKLFFVVVLLGIFSCQGLNNSIKRNKRKTLEVFDLMFMKNGNAFSTGSTNTDFAFVWSYKDDRTIFYQFSDGRVIEEKEFEQSSKLWLNDVPNKSEMFFMECYELDGDYVKYKILKNDNIFEDVLPVNLDCFIEKSKDKVFFKNLAEEIKIYGAFW